MIGLLLVAFVIFLFFRSEVSADSAANHSDVRDDEEVIFFPGYALFDESRNDWTMRIHGWIFEPEDDSWRRKVAIKAFGRSLGLDLSQVSGRSFEQRARMFLVDNERNKKIVVNLGGKLYQMNKSGKEGHFQGNVGVADGVISKVERDRGYISYSAQLRPGDERRFEGKVRLINASGFSVISDIDDTIKISEVSNKSKLLKNTFVNEFKAVAGMSEFYRSLKQQGACFHYLSSSPWQLYPSLSNFIKQHEFPGGSFHLKTFRWKDKRFFDLFASPFDAKVEGIERLLKEVPQRKFILVGDSGEKDPEVYGEIARRFPKQIKQIYIRDVGTVDVGVERFQKAFYDLPKERWLVFGDASELSQN